MDLLGNWFGSLLSYLCVKKMRISVIYAGKKSISGSFIGSMEETQEILEFWAEKGLTTMIEIVKMDYVNEAFKRMERNDVRYRFVLDVAGSVLES